MVFPNFERIRSGFRNPFRVLGLLFTFFLFTLVSSCDNDDFQIPEPPSFDWKGAIYQNPVPVDQIQEPDCDTIWHEEYVSYRKSGDPIVWKIKLNKSRRDMIAYLSYVPDLEAGQDEPPGHYTLCIKDLISGEVTLVDEMWQGYHLGFDFAGDYLIYERNFGGYLFNWKTEEKEKLGIHLDDPSISPTAKYISYENLNFENKGDQVIINTESGEVVFSVNDREVYGNLIWESDDVVIHKTIGSKLRRLDLKVDAEFRDYLGPFNTGIGRLVGFSTDGRYLYGNSQSISNLSTLKVEDTWYPAAIGDCANRDLEDFFILPDNTFMMRKTYYISDHEKRTVHPEYHWHLFDADGSNERRVELQL